MRTKSFVLLILFAGVLIYIFVPVILKVWRLGHQTDYLEAEIQVLSAKTQVLTNELRLLQNDPIYIESIARRTFNKAKEGEVVYKFVDPKELSSGNASSSGVDENPQ